MLRPLFISGITFFLSLIFISLTDDFVFTVILYLSAFISALLLLINANLKNTLYLVIALTVFAAALSFNLKTRYDYYPALLRVGENIEISGEITDDLGYNENGVKRFVIKSNGDKIRLSSSSINNAKIGDIVYFLGTVFELSENDDDIKNYYKSKSIYLGAYTMNEITVKKADSRNINYYLNELQNAIKEKINSVLPNQEGAVLTAMLLGDKDSMSDETKTAFKQSGVMHLFAVSGLHLSLWSGLFFMLANKLLRDKRIAALLSIGFTLFFMGLSAFSDSVVRAGIMMIVIYAGNLFRLKADSLNSLGFAALLICVMNPFSCYSVGFLLSFFSTLSLLSLAPLFKPKYFKTFWISICALISTLPVMLLFFDSISLISPITNFLVLWSSEIALLFSGFGTIFSFIEVLSFFKFPMFFISGVISKYMLFVCQKTAMIPLSNISVDSDFSGIFLGLSLILVSFSLISVKNSKKRFISVFLLCIIVFEIGVFTLDLSRKNVTSIKILGVGNGSFILLEKGDKTAVIGCGGDYYAYESAKAKILSETGIDLLVIPRKKDTESCFYSDIMSDFTPKTLVVPSDFDIGEVKKTTKVITCDYATLTIWDNVKIEYFGENQPLRIEIDDFSMVFSFFPGCENADSSVFSSDLIFARADLPLFLDRSNFNGIILSKDIEKTIKINTRNGKYTVEEID